MWWVNLSKAEAGRKDSLHVSPLLEIANAQASEGRAIFPLSSTHFIEIAKIGNPDQRARIAKIMVELSRGWFIAAPSIVAFSGLRNSVAKFFKLPVSPKVVDPFSQNISNAFGRAASKMLVDFPFAMSMLKYLPVLENYLAFSHLHRSILTLQSEIRSDREKQRGLTVNETKDMRKRVYCARLTMCIEQELNMVLRELGIPLEALNDIGPSGCIEILEGVPPWDVEIALNVERDAHRDRRIQANDEMDIGFLSMAIPYCDAVVTEKFWTDLTKRAKLDRKYVTHVTANLSEVF